MDMPKNTTNTGLVLHFMRGRRRFYALAYFSALTVIILSYINPLIMRLTVDSVLGDKPFEAPAFIINWIEQIGGRPYLRENLYICALVMAGTAILSGGLNFVRSYSVARGAEGIIRAMRESLFSHIQRLPYDWHIKAQTGDIIQRCTSDIETVRTFMSNQIIEVARIITLIVVALIFMFSLNVKMSVIALVYMPVIIAFSFMFYSRVGKQFLKADEAEGTLSAIAQENFTGVRVVRAFGRERQELEKFDKQNELYTSMWVRLGTLLSFFWSSGDIITGFLTVSVLATGVYETVYNGMTLGTFLAFTSYTAMMMWPVRGLGRVLSEMAKTGVSFGRINEIFRAETEKETPDAQKPPLTGDICFENVSFSYNPDEPVVKDVSFTIKSGQTIAFLGATGSGKSTLAHLLCRLYDIPENSGRITVGGVDIKSVDLRYLRSRIGLVLQEPFLFSKTIRENIAVAAENASLEEVRAACAAAALDASVSEFKDGFDTIVGERGVTLSGGQKQRASIARMLMQDTDIMIFDDSMSAVDTETEAMIRRELRKRTGRKTAIIISHRITTLMQADCIIVFEDGRIADTGTHGELVAREGLYSRIYEMQTGIEEDVLRELETEADDTPL